MMIRVADMATLAVLRVLAVLARHHGWHGLLDPRFAAFGVWT